MFDKFPSPCGVMGVKQFKISIRVEAFKFVSVPLRGNGCETNWLVLMTSVLTPALVSVPLRGNGCETLWEKERLK